jgi:hypothetical protein
MRRAVIAAVAGVVVLAGCTGVPSSSAPETIEALDTGGASATQAALPNLTGGARDIVDRFIHANATASADPNYARQFLTREAAAQWGGSDSTATIMANDYTVGTYNAHDHTVTVTGKVLGTLSAGGVYTPSLQGEGQGGEKVPFVFDMAKIDSEFRIAKLHAGLLLVDDDFRATYRQQALYFFDLAGDSLVPDLRWSALDDKEQLATWLLAQIVNGPRPELQSAVSADTMPAESDPRQFNVTLGSPTTIEIPGSDQLPPDARDRLAAQLAQTLRETLAGRDMSITDGRTPVSIPRVGGDTFSATDFASAIGPPEIPSAVYYLANGRIRDDAGKPVPGIANSAAFTSVALGRTSLNGPLLVAGVSGSGNAARLEVGTAIKGGTLRTTSLHGPLTRPAFVPGRSEVWVGSGSRLYRVVIDADPPRPEQVPLLAGAGRIVALRLSPEGSRIAIVIAGGNGLTQLYVGSVVRGAGPPRVDKVQPISPEGVVVQDVAWLDRFKLFAIGYLAGSLDSRTFETGVDGTDWTNSTIPNLPGSPDAVAATTAASVWLSAGGFVWKQSGNAWVSPGQTGQTPGTAPVYLE